MPEIILENGELHTVPQEQVNHVRAKLKRFIAEESVEDNNCPGLCHYISNGLVEGVIWYYWVTTSSLDWESKAKDQADCFPVKHNFKYSKWEGPNLTARLSLAKHLLKKLDEQCPEGEIV